MPPTGRVHIVVRNENRKTSVDTQGGRFTLDQWQVVLPVIVDLFAIQQANTAGNHGIIGHQVDPCRCRRLLTQCLANLQGTE